jgi:hypothetical protein
MSVFQGIQRAKHNPLNLNRPMPNGTTACVRYWSWVTNHDEQLASTCTVHALYGCWGGFYSRAVSDPANAGRGFPGKPQKPPPPLKLPGFYLERGEVVNFRMLMQFRAGYIIVKTDTSLPILQSGWEGGYPIESPL